METMKNRQLKRTGLILILAGMIGVVITTAGMIGAYRKAAPGTGSTLSTADYAKDIAGGFLPAEIGFPLILIGLILLLLGWWRARSTKTPSLLL